MRHTRSSSNQALSAYENGHIYLWSLNSPNVPLCILDVAPLTPLSLDFDSGKMCGLAAGNEHFIVTFSVGQLEDEQWKMEMLTKR